MRVTLCGCYIVWVLHCVGVTLCGCYIVWVLHCVGVTLCGCYIVWVLPLVHSLYFFLSLAKVIHT
jgi:hypothetical protein